MSCVAIWLQTSILHLEYLFRILITLVHFSAIIPVHLFCLYANMTAVMTILYNMTILCALWHHGIYEHKLILLCKARNSVVTAALSRNHPVGVIDPSMLKALRCFGFPLLWISPGPHRHDVLYHRATCLTSRVLLRTVYITIKETFSKRNKRKSSNFYLSLSYFFKWEGLFM